ncbi:hypothetical protein BGZ95_003552 [Linnemannia exigua]|uniref:Peptidase M16 C-terminal domain-containing protein n=1 Tax=Linnemannia exigua TaxID=604196 RepID=A0AAD4D448_9FUNG|nr:hypothetical protein BGZ95_003552 [Linnemannia exigua]
MDHFLLESEVSLPGPSLPTPVAVYKHRATSMRFVFVSIPGPQATATIITEDYTGYTIATAGRDGMAEILPVFLDHVLHPTLRDDQYVTEVYHVDGEGKQQGVVFSEMAARENSEADLLDLGLRRLLYPDTQTYYYECGGLTPEIPKMTNDDIREYHKKFYHPSNMTIVVAGDSLQPDRIFDTLIRQKILDGVKTEIFDIIQEMDLSKGRGDAPIMSKETKLTTRTIRFPSADEDVGSIGYAWLGPNIYDIRTMVALDILFRFLHETSASPFSQEFVERRNPIASHVDFDVKGCMDSSLLLLFSGVPIRPKAKSTKSKNGDAEGADAPMSGDEEQEEGDEEQDEEDEDDDQGDDSEGDQSDEDEEEDEDEDEDDEEGDEKESEGADGDDAEESQDLFEPGYFHSLVLKVLDEFVTNGLSDPTEMSRIIARHRTKIYESIEDDPHEAATSYLVPDILAYAYLEKDKTKPASIGTRSNIFAIIDEMETMEPSFWRDLARTWLLEPSMVEVQMIPNSQLGKAIKSTVSQNHKDLVESYGVEGLAKQGVIVAEAVEANKVDMTPEIIATMPPIPDASQVPTIPIESSYVVTGSQGKDESRPFKVVQVVETNTFFTHVKLCLPLTHLDEDLRPYLVLFQELVFQSSCAIPKYAGEEGSEEIVFENLDYQSVVTLVSNTFVSHEAAVGFGNDIFACSWLSELFVLACSAERSKFKEQCQLLLRVLMFTEFTEDRILTVAKNLVTQIMELKRDGADMLAMVSTRMTTPVRGYELSTGYCRKMDMTPRPKTNPAQLESATPILGNDMAISAFRQEPFLKRIIQELKQKTDQVPKILSRLERIKQAMLQSISEVMMSSKRNGNTQAAGFAQIGVPIGFGAETTDPVKMLTEVWDQEHALYQATSGVSLAYSAAALNSKKRKPSEPFHQEQDKPSIRISKDEVEATVKTSNLTLNDGSQPTNGLTNQGLNPFPFPRTPYRPLAASNGVKAPNSVLIPSKSITSSYLVSIVPCDIVYHPEKATEENHLDQYATLLLCEILSRSEGPLYSAIRGQGYAYGCSISVYLWTAQMAFEVRDAMDPVKAYDAFLDIIRRMETEWEATVGGQFEIETAMASQAYQTCMERATAGGALSWVLRGAVRGYTSVDELSKTGNYLYKVTVADLKRVYSKYFKQFLNGRDGLTTVLLTPPSPPESIKSHFAQYGIDFQEAALLDFEIESTYDFVPSSSAPSSRIISPAGTTPGSPLSSSSSSMA